VLTWIGPGLAVAATGVGAGDLLAAMVAGADFGFALLWVIVVGAALKLALNEGVARWQLATSSTLLEGWCRHLGPVFTVGFGAYLVLWSFIVASGLMSACGVAAHALLPGVGVRGWGMAHSLAALVLVLVGRYHVFERTMKVLIAVMVATLAASVVLIGPDLGAVVRGLAPTLPRSSAGALLSLMGGVGGSVTLLSYGYWIRERGWLGVSSLPRVRIDLAVGYVVTGLFGVAMLVLAASALAGGGGMPPGSEGLVACGDAVAAATAPRLGAGTGEAARMVFLVGVWGAVFTSTLGVWQGVPYLFTDFVTSMRGRTDPVDVTGATYRAYLLYLAVPPMAVLFLGRPIWVVKLYTLTGGLFMPVLAGSLLWLNTRRRHLGAVRNGVVANVALAAALALFVAIAIRQAIDVLG
jgi:Mn2+/Fe2+ NRAMP family transporter